MMPYCCLTDQNCVLRLQQASATGFCGRRMTQHAFAVRWPMQRPTDQLNYGIHRPPCEMAAIPRVQAAAQQPSFHGCDAVPAQVKHTQRGSIQQRRWPPASWRPMQQPMHLHTSSATSGPTPARNVASNLTSDPPTTMPSAGHWNAPWPNCAPPPASPQAATCTKRPAAQRLHLQPPAAPPPRSPPCPAPLC